MLALHIPLLATILHLFRILFVLITSNNYVYILHTVCEYKNQRIIESVAMSSFEQTDILDFILERSDISHQSKVIFKSGMSISPSLYFWTSRSSNVDISTIITSLVPLQPEENYPSNVPKSFVEFKKITSKSPLDHTPIATIQNMEKLKLHQQLIMEQQAFKSILNEHHNHKQLRIQHSIVKIQSYFRGYLVRRIANYRYYQINQSQRDLRSSLRSVLKNNYSILSELRSQNPRQSNQDLHDYFAGVVAFNSNQEEIVNNNGSPMQKTPLVVYSSDSHSVESLLFTKNFNSRPFLFNKYDSLIYKTDRRNACAIFIQTHIRKFLALQCYRQKRWIALTTRRYRAAQTIQSLIRGYMCRKVTAHLFWVDKKQREVSAVIAIQRLFRYDLPFCKLQ